MATDFYVPPSYGSGPVSMGSLDAMRAEQLAQQAAQATRSQASQLINARLSSMTSNMPDLGPLPNLEGGMNPAQARASLFPRALEAGPQPLGPMYGPGIPVNGAGIVNPGATAAEQLGASVLPEAEAAPGLLARLGASTGLGGAGIGGALGVMKGRIGPALAYAAPAEALALGTKYLGPSLVSALGLHVAPGSLEAGSAAGQDVATGAAIGTLVAPGPGTVIGAGLGGVKGLMSVAPEALADLAGNGPAQQWKSAISDFDKTIMGYKKGSVGQSGQDYVNQTYLPAGMKVMNAARAGQISHEDAIATLQKLTDAMKTDYTTAKSQYKATSVGNKSDQRLAIQMGQAMGQLGQNYVAQAKGAADMERQQALAQPSLAPVLNVDAASREAYAKQMAGAFQASAYITPTINKMDQQVAYQQQLLQQIRAAQTSASAGGSSSLSGALNSSAQAQQGAQATANQYTQAQAAAMAQLGGG